MGTKEEKKIELVTNSPIVDEKSYGDYVEILNEKIHDKDVKNIGIIAPYGAGKSSLIKTYQNKYPKEKSFTISLANFNSNVDSVSKTKNKSNKANKADNVNSVDNVVNTNNDNDNTNINSYVSDIECEVEKSILQQFLFSESKRKMPNSKMNRIGVHHFWYSILFSVFTLALVGLLSCAVLEILCLLPNSTGNNFYWFFSFAIFSAVILLFAVVYNRKLERIGVKDIEATFCESQGSILNTFIDELLYFFHVTKISNVIIEDLDRFNNTNLFSKLREINFIINNSKIVKQKVTFIYAVKDDLFVTEEDRAKFFEFIISLTPILNSDNAQDYLKNALESCSQEMKLPESYMAEVTQFIQEMRVLKNIINDYKVYYHTLNIKKLNNENKSIKLFSLMVYKNLRPQDFAKLQFSEGYLAEIFKTADVYKSKLSEECDNKIEELKLKINEAKREETEDFEKLKHIVRSIIVTKGNNGYARGAEIGGILTFKDLNENSNIYFSRYNTFYLSVGFIEHELGEKLVDFEDRINNKSEDSQRKTNEEILSKLIEKKKLVNYSVKEILLLNKEFEINDELLRYLLVNGYIAEDYLDYIIKVGDTVITNNDRQFIKDVLAKKEIEYAKKLDKPELVYQKILPERFTDRYVLNYDLINFVFQDNIFGNKQENIIKYLTSGEVGAIKFIIAYLNDENSYELLIDNLSEKYEELSFIILTSSEISFKTKVNYLKCLIALKKVDSIVRQNIKNSIADYLYSLSKAIDLLSPVNPERFFNLIDDLNIKLKDISCDKINYEMANKLIGISAYEINKSNLEFILFELFGLESSQFQNAFMSAILGCGNRDVLEYCAENSNKLLDIILSLDNCYERQNAIEVILSDNKLIKETKEKFITKLQNRFSTFDNIGKDILNFSLTENKITDSWDEIIKVFESGKAVYDNLYIFIKLNIDNLSAQELKNEGLVLFIIKNFEAKTEEDFVILNKIANAVQITISAEEIKEDLICAALVEKNVILASEENLMICCNKPNSIIAMFLKNPELIKFIKCDDFTGEIVEQILLSSKSNSIKLDILNALEDLCTPSSEVIKVLVNYLLNINFAQYPIIFLKAIFEDDSIDKKDKIKLFNQYSGKASKSELFSLFKPWSEKFSDLEANGKVKISFSEISNEILAALEAKDLIRIETFKLIKRLHKKF